MSVTLVGSIIGGAGDYLQVDPGGGRRYGQVELRHRQPPLIPLLDGHGGPAVGEVVHLEQLLDSAAVRIVAVCDLDPAELENRQLSMGVTGRPGRREWEIREGVLDHVALVERGGAMVGPISVVADYDVRRADAILPSCGAGLRGILDRAHTARYSPRVVHGQVTENWTEVRNMARLEDRIEHSAPWASTILRVR